MTTRVAVVLTIVNAAVLAATLAERTVTNAQEVPGVVRARAWELVDQRGVTRASMEVAPDGGAVLRLRDASGTIRVKLGADAHGSGLVLLNGSTELGAQVFAGADGSRLTLTNPDGRSHIIRP